MLNPFPHLLVYGIFVPFLIRIALGTVLLYLSVEHFRFRNQIKEELSPVMGRSGKIAVVLLGLTEITAGALLVVGAWTQIAAIVAILLALKSFFIRSSLPFLYPFARVTYLLLVVMALSLLMSGAGGFAFDLPL